MEDLFLHVCDQKQEKICWMFGKKCSACYRRKVDDIHPYCFHLLRLRNLRNTGYPFQQDTLPEEQWIDLSRLDKIIEGIKTSGKKPSPNPIRG